MPEDENTGADLQPEDQPSPDDTTPDTGNQVDDEGSQESSFLDDYDLGEVPDDVRPVAEATVKRLNAAYTRRRQQDSQALRKAQEYQELVEGLEDPQAGPEILRRLGYDVLDPEVAEKPDDLDFEDPNERIDALEQRFAQQQETMAAEARAQAESAYMSEQIEDLEAKLDVEFGDEELEALALLADENRDQNGVPDVEAAFRVLEAIGASHHARASRRKPRVRRPGQGSTGERQVDLTDPEKRLEAGLAAAREALASSE